MLLIGINHYLSLGRGKGGIPWLKGEPREGGGGQALPTKYQGRTVEFQKKAVAQFVNAKRLFG